MLLNSVNTFTLLYQYILSQTTTTVPRILQVAGFFLSSTEKVNNCINEYVIIIIVIIYCFKQI